MKKIFNVNLRLSLYLLAFFRLARPMLVLKRREQSLNPQTQNQDEKQDKCNDSGNGGNESARLFAASNLRRQVSMRLLSC